MNLQNSLTALGYAGKVLALRMGCTGDGKIRRVNRYASNAASAISAECDVAQACGVSGFVHIWDGTVDAFINSSMEGMWAECEKRGMLFAVMLDQWMAKNQKPDPTTATINQIKSTAFQEVLNSSCYLPEKYLLEFNLAPSAGVNIAKLKAAFPTLKILSWNNGYSWPNIPPNNPSPQPVMALCPFFNDGGRPVPNGINPPWDGKSRNWSASYWGSNTTPNRVNDHEGGNYWMDQLANIPKAAPYFMIATWDDFEESTAVLEYLAAMCCIRIA
jgi:hypothetical protein